MKRSNYALGFAMALIGAFMFSAKAIYVKLVYRTEAIDAISMLALRMLFSLPFYIVTAWVLARRPDNVKLKPRQWGWLLVLGLLGYYLSSLFDFMGLAYISAGLERLILFLYPTFALLIGAVAFRRKIQRIQWIALLIAYLGMIVAFMGDVQQEWNPSVMLAGTGLRGHLCFLYRGRWRADPPDRVYEIHGLCADDGGCGHLYTVFHQAWCGGPSFFRPHLLAVFPDGDRINGDPYFPYQRRHPQDRFR